MKTIWVLTYDHDWGMRGSRTKSEFFLTEKLNKKETIKFLSEKLNKSESNLNTQAIDYKEIVLGEERKITTSNNYLF